MMRLWTVTWARALGGDELPTDAFCGCAGVFHSPSAARNCLEEEKDRLIKSFDTDFDDEDELAEVKKHLQIAGSRGEEFYEIDYTAPDDTRIQWYFAVNEVELEDEV